MKPSWVQISLLIAGPSAFAAPVSQTAPETVVTVSCQVCATNLSKWTSDVETCTTKPQVLKTRTIYLSRSSAMTTCTTKPEDIETGATTITRTSDMTTCTRMPEDAKTGTTNITRTSDITTCTTEPEDVETVATTMTRTSDVKMCLTIPEEVKRCILKVIKTCTPKPEGAKTCKTDSTDEDGKAEAAFEATFHLSIALCGSFLLLFFKYYVQTHGYTLSHRWWRSTDDQMWIMMGLVCTTWTVLIPASASRKDWDYCPQMARWGGYEYWARLAWVPWILDGAFVWWLYRYVKQRLSIFPRRDQFTQEAIFVSVLTALPASWAAAGALETQFFVLGMLTITYIVLFVIILLTSYENLDYDNRKDHLYAMDDIRVPLISTCDTGMAYVLPSLTCPWMACILPPCCHKWAYHYSGFNPVLHYNLRFEQDLLDSKKQFFEPIDRQEWSLRACTASVNAIVTKLMRNTEDDRTSIRNLASWLYGHGAKPNVALPMLPRTNGVLRPNYTLLGRDLVLALLLWEHLVFERRWQLDDELRDQVWLLREQKYSGAGLNDSPNGITAMDGITTAKGNPATGGSLHGFLEAVSEVYRILATPNTDLSSRQPSEVINRIRYLDSDNSKIPLPASVVSTLNPVRSVQDYTEGLWRACWAEYPSTFGALYLWTTVWYIDMGNVGFHTTPLVPDDRHLWLDGIPRYLTAWRMEWRYLWHGSVICQLIIMLPTTIGSLISLSTIL